MRYLVILKDGTGRPGAYAMSESREVANYKAQRKWDEYTDQDYKERVTYQSSEGGRYYKQIL